MKPVLLARGNFRESVFKRDGHKYIKYPRTMHLPWSESKTDDDRTLESIGAFKGKEVVVTLKMDGENTSLYSDGYCHARSIDAEPHHTQSWCRNLASKIAHDIPDGWRLCGENLWAKHSIGYDNLKSYFYLFSVWNKENTCLSWAETQEWAALLGLTTVPVIYQGLFNEKSIKAAFEPHRPNHEGYVIRLSSAFPYGQFKIAVAKFVRKNHVQTSNNWKREKIEKNQLSG